MSVSPPKVRSIRVLLVDDHAIVRQGLRCTLEVYPSIEVVGEASDGEEVLACIEKVQPTAVVMDIILPKMDGIAASRLIKTKYPQVAIVGLTSGPKDYMLYSMRKAGAFEVVDKQNTVDELYARDTKSVSRHRREDCRPARTRPWPWFHDWRLKPSF